MRYYSYAGTSRGSGDPENIEQITADEDGSWDNGEYEKTGSHLLIRWSGGEYSRSNTWIAADRDAFEPLEDME